MSQSYVEEAGDYRNNINSFNTEHSFNTTTINNVYPMNNSGGEDERDKILAWLSPLEPRIRHEDIRAQRVDLVGGWLLRTAEYQNWFDGIRREEPDSSVLFCYGDPGVGKTYIR